MLHHLIKQAAGDVAVPAEPVTASRRSFLKGAGAVGGGLVIGAMLPKAAFAAETKGPTIIGPADPRPQAFLRIAPDNTVTVLVKHLDKGQGIMTGLTTIVAEELDADWQQMRGAFAPADSTLYANHFFGIQGTGGSTAVANSWDELRMAGAAARAMLVATASARWNVPVSEITVEKGVVRHAKSNRTANFGALAEDAAKLPVPQKVALKDPKDYKLIGDPSLHRLDYVSKTNGTAIFAMDIRRPGQVTAVLARSPRFGGTVKSVDSAAAKQVPGVIDVLTLPVGVAVVAKNTWAAIKGREALKVEWDDAKAETRGTEEILADYRKLAEKQGNVAANKGDAAKALAGAAKVVEAEFVFPYLAHAPMEPLNATVELKPEGGCTIYAGSQFQGVEQKVAAAILGCKPEQVAIDTVWAGGSFGRRATPNADYIAEAVMIAKAYGKAPVHLVWTREDDIQGGRYRPLFLHKIKAGVDAQGKLVAWQQRIVGQSFMAGTPFEPVMIKNGVDETSVEGASDMAYAVPNLAVDLHTPVSPVTTLWWRSVGHTHTAYAKEVMIDELAAAAGKDPVAFRTELLKDSPRLLGVLKLAAEKADWSKPLPKGRARGVAVHESFDTFVAHVAEVSVNDKGQVKVERVVCAVDCGQAVNPNIIEAQISGGTGWGIGHALRDEITMTGGVVDQANFDTYQPLRNSEMPPVEVHILPSTVRPTGVGEPGVPTAAPAVANAVFAATGKRLHQLPFTKSGMV
ncbi:xanthine dehydrogenase family protein molybdopterin-binding subunit [Azospirillum rugosum]|uniref:Isoquinoline 1-oxidoreductase beta subunit n=1 Tax=Azospirillum rugosum TaxID=416170 RepID=A0ABS4STE0_9PROT|nr:xanthine dehydrogenase family protein molybdopterin-binding subunit [Azospirillum rugosum]MBP2295831.1 isoquinoline 1-oxidoreductase beta subunit [Azospirillum rugosum]MDQ0529058.1 isoquinoline 1-oxidoreductase beta subunit [Azospirillum rugosum]